MGNCCTDDSKDLDARAGNIKQGTVDATAFKLKDYQTKFVPQTFSNIPPAEKDQLLAEVLKIIMTQGNLARVQPNNPHLKDILKKVVNKFQQGTCTFEGETIDGIGNGRAKITYKDGSVFEGFVANGFEQGDAKIKLQDGKVVNATFNRGLVEGLADTTHEGVHTQWLYVNGQKNGPQVITDKDRIEFSNWRGDQKEGYEVSIIKNANKITLAEYKNGKPEGQPKEYFIDNSIKTVKQNQPPHEQGHHPHSHQTNGQGQLPQGNPQQGNQPPAQQQLPQNTNAQQQPKPTLK